jgi:hypothetical protein
VRGIVIVDPFIHGWLPGKWVPAVGTGACVMR